MKGKFYRWLAMALVLALLTMSGVTATSEPTGEQTPETTVEAATSVPMAEQTPEAMMEAATSEPTVELTPETTIEVAASVPAAEQTPEATMEAATSEPTAEAETPAPTEEAATSAPTAELTPEATMQAATSVPAAEQTPEATIEAATSEPTVELTPEATMQAATSAPTVEATPEATVEATLKPAADVFALGATSASEECTHAHQWSKEERADVEYSNPTAEGHTVSYYSIIHHTCDDCGKTWSDEMSAEKKTAQETHEFYKGDGICAECGYTCRHLKVDLLSSMDNRVYTSLDAYMHVCSYTLLEEYYCHDCGKYWEKSSENGVTQKEMHDWDSDDVCVWCGTTNTCTHPNKVLLEEYTYADEENCVDNGESGHTILSGTKDQLWYCYDCNNSIYISDIALPGSGVQEPHQYGRYDWDNVERVCSLCGHVLSCTHENSYVREPWPVTWEYVRQEGERGHTLVNAKLEVSRVCNDCKKSWVEYEWGKDYFEEHYSSGGKRCNVCGYDIDNSCTHPKVKQLWMEYIVVDADSYENVGAEGHYATCIQNVSYLCEDCGYYWEETKTAARTLVPHELKSGRCVCGYESHCAHENIVIYEDSYNEKEGLDICYVNPDAEGHTCIKEAAYDTKCADCGEIFVDGQVIKQTTAREPHEFVDGKCKWCNYVYVEPTVTPAPTVTAAPSAEPTAPVETNEPNVTPEPTMPAVTDEPVVTPEPTATAAPSAEPTAPAETDEPVVTPEPTMPAVTDTPIATPTAEATAKPTAKPTAAPTKKPVAAPTAKPAPMYTQLPENEALHGVKVEDAPNLLEAISVVAEALENQGTSVQVRLLKVDKVLTKEEMAKLDALPLKEQMLTVLSVIGFEEEVSRTLEAEGQELSAGAQALKEEVQARVAAMTEAEYAEFEAMLLESFPRETVVIDGVEYTFFTLELEVREGDAVRYERYGFRLEGDEWILTRLEVA